MVQRNALRLFCLISTLILGVTLVACGGGGGGGGGGTPNLLGTVSDSERQPIAGADVKVYDDIGVQISSTTSNAAGRYGLTALPVDKPLTLVVTGPAGSFPAQAEGITLTSGVASVLDIYLPTTAAATLASANLWQSQATLRSAQAAILDTSASAPAPTSVYLAPYDVAEIGNGYPIYSVSPLAIGDSTITEFFAAAGVSSDVSFDQADLYLPVPASLVTAANAADTGATDALYLFDPATASWTITGIDPTLTTDPVNGDPAFRATITTAGLYRVGASATADSTVGTILYSDLTPAAGITVFVTGTDYGYQQVAVTDVNGQFTALTKTGGSSSYEFVAWGYGLQLSATDSAASTTLPFDAPLANTPAQAAITVASAGTNSIGLIAASGRLTTDPELIDGTLTTPGRADVSFNYDAFNGLTFNATTKMSGIQEITGTSFDGLIVAPGSGYSAYDGITFPSIVIDPGGGQVFVIKTSAGYAKVGIDSVSGSDPYTLNIRATFSLNGIF